ncbi:MAG: arsenate reductase ArsC [Flammeovirgaceae bacterium]|nr:arsenate reductase ArsC [Flammeovirgaceae bacterium]
MTKINILVLCVGNSCRSQMAQGYLQHFGGDRVDVLSAGSEKHGLNQNAVLVMQEDGIDISHHTSNLVSEYADRTFDYVLTVCEDADTACPYFPARLKNIHRGFPDPAKATGNHKTILVEFRKVRNDIKEYCQSLLSELKILNE